MGSGIIAGGGLERHPTVRISEILERKCKFITYLFRKVNSLVQAFPSSYRVEFGIRLKVRLCTMKNIFIWTIAELGGRDKTPAMGVGLVRKMRDFDPSFKLYSPFWWGIDLFKNMIPLRYIRSYYLKLYMVYGSGHGVRSTLQRTPRISVKNKSKNNIWTPFLTTLSQISTYPSQISTYQNSYLYCHLLLYNNAIYKYIIECYSWLY